jgi:ribosomal protein L37AE/L43A
VVCGSCGKRATVQLISGLWRCQDCFDLVHGVCAWPREFARNQQEAIDRPWRKWLETPAETEWYR